MNFKRKLLIIVSFLTFVFPIFVSAYSNQVILGGENIGISVNTKDILVVGFYKVNGKYIAKESGFLEGDRIIRVNGNEVGSIEDLIKEINKSGSDRVTFSVKRLESTLDISLDLALFLITSAIGFTIVLGVILCSRL